MSKDKDDLNRSKSSSYFEIFNFIITKTNYNMDEFKLKFKKYLFEMD